MTEENRGAEGRAHWTPEERAYYDAKAEEEAWDLAWRILTPWVESAREIGSDELTEVMEGALREVERRVNAAVDRLERAEAALEGSDAD